MILTQPTRRRFTAAILLYSCMISGASAAPVVSNVNASQRVGTKWVDVTYDLAGTGAMTVRMEVSADNGASFTIPAVTATGAFGSGVSAGTKKTIVWNAGSDFDGRWSPQTKVKVIALDGAAQPVPAGMEYIPAGSAAGAFVSAYYMDRFEVTKLLWDIVNQWATGHGYGIAGGTGAGDNHPVVSVNWYDCVKWANAKSEREGLTPCYYTDVAQTTVYRLGEVNVLNSMVKWNANGYRLPTEVEWERAARADTLTDYWWGNAITNADCNFPSSGAPFSSFAIGTTPVGYYNGTTYNLVGGSTFVTNNRRNAFGLYDVSGNVLEWCWDKYSTTYPISTSNPHGAEWTVDSSRVFRGGAWNAPFNDQRLYSRFDWFGNYRTTARIHSLGFRLARGLP